MKQLQEIISSTMNDTINGEPSNIDEVFCCLSHKYSGDYQHHTLL